MNVSQDMVAAWVEKCFGEPPLPSNIGERRKRFLEEALELVQSVGMTKEEAIQLVDYVFSRPVEDDPRKEFGGTVTTVMALAQSAGYDLATAVNDEFDRMTANIDKIRAKQQAKPVEVKG